MKLFYSHWLYEPPSENFELLELDSLTSSVTGNQEKGCVQGLSVHFNIPNRETDRKSIPSFSFQYYRMRENRQSLNNS